MGSTQHYTEINIAIIERCKKGERKAFQELYNLYAKAMLNISVRILNNKEEAQEVLQDAFLAVFENIGTYDKKYAFGVWLKRIVINRSLNVLKKRKLVFVALKDVNDINEASEDADSYEEEYDVTIIKKCIGQLPDGYRTIFSLFLFEKYSHKEIAALLNISEGTSKSQYNRAKKKLTELVKEKTITNDK